MTPQEKQVSKAFSSYWKAHFSRGKGAFEKVLSFWHPDITAIGTGKDEIVKSYSGFKKFLKREFEEVNTTMPVRILWTKVQLQKDLALVLAETEVIVSKEKNIKMRFRQSSVFKKHKDKWLLYHIHGSIPASAQRENESFPIDGLIAEKEKLEKEVAEKTADLLNKNRELEIEAALERVRTIAMGMHKSEDLLNVSEILYLELNKLGFDEMRNAMINIHNDENKTFINYDYSDVIGKSKTLLNFNTHPVMEKQIRQSRIANDAFSEAVYKGKDLEEWKEFRKKYGEKDDPRIDKINALYYYFYSIGSGTIGISTFSQINEEKLTLLKRFRNVFSLAYQRYSDIALAEAQAREAQIELGLERVRARAMAMHKSEELNDVVMTLFDQMKDLEIDIDGININILNDDLTGFDSWFAAPGYTKAVCLYTPYFDTPAMNDIFNAVKNKWDLLSKIYPKEEKDAYFTYLYEHSDYKNLPNERKKMILDAESWCLSVGIANNTGISIHSYTGKTFSEKEHDILKRFAKVFSQTYTRFLDLQKAEAQAREAQIEAALERVRSRTMAMQKSEDLNKAASDMFKQIQVLGMQPWGCGFNIFDKDEKLLPNT
jgi:hypothetical protein